MAAPIFTLLDLNPVAARAPNTASLPNSVELTAVGEGDFVKLIFEYGHETHEWPMEAMWVVVEEAGDNKLLGVLDNDPAEPTTSLVAGDRIGFERHHIVKIRWAHPENAPPRSERREYWDRCLVDVCVLDGTQPIEYLCRDEPCLHSENDEHPDSGWRIHGRFGPGGVGELQARRVEYVALGVVLNQDDSWLHLIDTPVGSRFLRDFQTDTYFEPDDRAS